jgi:hypothetical protein
MPLHSHPNPFEMFLALVSSILRKSYSWLFRHAFQQVDGSKLYLVSAPPPLPLKGRWPVPIWHLNLMARQIKHKTSVMTTTKPHIVTATLHCVTDNRVGLMSLTLANQIGLQCKLCSCIHGTENVYCEGNQQQLERIPRTGPFSKLVWAYVVLERMWSPLPPGIIELDLRTSRCVGVDVEELLPPWGQAKVWAGDVGGPPWTTQGPRPRLMVWGRSLPK